MFVCSARLCGTLSPIYASRPVLPVVTRGMIEPSAMRRFFDSRDLSSPSTTDHTKSHCLRPNFRGATSDGGKSRPHPRIKSSSAGPLRLPGMTSRFVKGLKRSRIANLATISTHAYCGASGRSCRTEVLASICLGSSVVGPSKRIWPRLSGRRHLHNKVQEALGGFKLSARPPSLRYTAETSTWQEVCKSGVSRDRIAFQKDVLPRLHCCGRERAGC